MFLAVHTSFRCFPVIEEQRERTDKDTEILFLRQGVLNSIIQYSSASSQADQGKINEQFVYWELRKNLDIRYTLFYWRTADGKEVDFVLEKDRKYLPIEVKTGSAGKIPSGILHFFSYYPETEQRSFSNDGPESVHSAEGRTVFLLAV
jgi:predicted AAA+ superfamily ATPase